MNPQQIITLYEQQTGKNASSKKGKFTESFKKFNRKLLKEGETVVVAYAKGKYYNPITDRVNKHTLGANNLPTTKSLQKLQKLRAEAKSKYIKSPDGILKIPQPQRKNPIPYLEQKFDLPGLKNYGQLKKKGYQLLKNIPSDLVIKGKLEITWDLMYDITKKQRTFTYVFPLDEGISASQLTDDFIYERIVGEFGESLDEKNLSADNIDVVIITPEGSRLKLKDMQLREKAPLKIHSLFNETIDNEGGNCVQTHLHNLWGKRASGKQKKMFETINTTEKLASFCRKYNIKMLAYDICGNKIEEVIPKKNNKNFANLVYVAYNNHLYPLQNKVLKKTYIEKLKFNHIPEPERCHSDFIKHIEDGVLPRIVAVNQSTKKITAFILEETIYFENKDFVKCRNILKKFGMQDRLNWFTKLTNIADIIQTIYVKKNIDSFWPDHSKYKKRGYNYRQQDCDVNELCSEEYVTMDKNKAYSNELRSLDYLISVDFKTAIFKKLDRIKSEDITPHYLYLVTVQSSNIFFDCTSIYTGEHILKAIKYGLVQGENFTIDEEIETEKHTNYFKKMIEDIYEKIPVKQAKRIVNSFIGRFELTSNLKHTNVPVKICNRDEAATFDGELVKLTDDYWIALELKSKANIINRKPLAIQIKDACRFRMFQFCIENKIDTDDVIQVKTDSITFKKKNDLYKSFISAGLGGWKIESFKDIIKSHPMNDEKLTMNFEKIQKEELINQMVYKNNTLVEGFAGIGKTKFIKDTLIPRIEADGESVLTLSPSHDAASEYRLAKKNCSVIQKYQHTTNIPSAQHIIIDEIGMVSSKDWEIIIKCKMLGKYIYAFGDFKQLPPVNSKKITENFLSSIFECRVKFTHNYRNNFTIAYYKKMINTTDHTWLRKQVKTVSEDVWDEDTMLIAYTNKTRHKHNAICCEKMGVPYEINEKKELFIHRDVPAGVPVICKYNALSMIGIYNKFSFKTNGHVWKESDDKPCLYIKLIEDNTDKEICLKYENLRKYFEYAYCRTAYSVQGKTIPKFKYCEEDLHFLNNETAYTIVSRKYQKKDNSNVEPYQLLDNIKDI